MADTFVARREQAHHDQLIGAVAGRRQECAADDSGPEGVFCVEVPAKLEDVELAGGCGHAVCGVPPARNQVRDGEHADHGSGYVNRQLNHVRPDHGRHAALEGVEQGEDHDDGDGRNIAAQVAVAVQKPGERDAHHDGNGEDANAIRGGARQQKQSGGERTQPLSEATFNELIGRDQVAAKVMRNQQQADDDAPDHVADD